MHSFDLLILNMSKKNTLSKLYPYFFVILISFKISWDVIGPALNNNLIVQDDFRQCCFWFWSAWDAELFKNDFFVPMYQAQASKSPLLLAIYRIAPLLSDNLIFYSKFLSLIIAVLTSITSFQFIKTFLVNYQAFNKNFSAIFIKQFTLIDLISIIFSSLITITIFCTDHITVSHARSFIWLFIFIYFTLKLKNYCIWANLLILFSLGLTPHAFLIIFVMEGIDQVLEYKYDFIDLKRKSFLYLAGNALIAGLFHLFFLGGKQTQGVGTPFSVAEMKKLAEFNPGGRHPIFGSNLFDGSWWTNEHWGLGIGYLKISEVVIWTFWLVLIYLFLYLSLKRRNIIFYNSFHSILKSKPAILLYASLSLYFFAQFLFPILYMPSRYIAVSLLLLSLLTMTILSAIWSYEIAQIISKKKTSLIMGLMMISLTSGFWMYFKNSYHARYVSIDGRINSLLESLPKNSLIAGHPLLPDLNVASITSKRSIFVDYERSMAYTKESLAEIRRRNEVALKMVYARDRNEFVSLAKANGITHFLAHYYFYAPEYLQKPVYMKPYDTLLSELCVLDDRKYYLQIVLEANKQSYFLIDIAKI